MQVPRWPGDHAPSRPLGPMHSDTLSPPLATPLSTRKQIVELLNKVVIFVFFAHKKYSCSFLKLQLIMSDGLIYRRHNYISEPGNISVALLSMQGFIKNILICVPCVLRVC